MSGPDLSRTVAQALDTFRIELPSWGFANTGTRFGKFLQPAAAATIEEKMQRCGAGPRAHRRVSHHCPSRPLGSARAGWTMSTTVRAAARAAGIEPGAINPNCLSGPALQVRLVRQSGSGGAASGRSITALESVAHCGRGSEPRRVAAGLPTVRTTRAPRTSVSASTGSKRGWRRCTRRSGPEQRMLVEYKPFEPAFYHTDIADWGMAHRCSRAPGRAASQGAGRYRPPLPVAEHRADRGVAAR